MGGRDVRVLVEKPGREAAQMVGKSEYLHAVHIENSQAKAGDIVHTRITGAKRNSLAGVAL
jgi:tRNA-2-methylthio-N6-dimethylallyladenosine synthase